MDSNYIDKKPLFDWLLEHIFYSDGSPKEISWMLKDREQTIEEKRDHAKIYLDKITIEQSKYIAYHVGIFWCIGTFRIKNGDTVNVMLDSKLMYNHLEKNASSNDDFIKTRISFIEQLIKQRKLKINYKLIEPKENLAAKLIKKVWNLRPTTVSKLVRVSNYK